MKILKSEQLCLHTNVLCSGPVILGGVHHPFPPESLQMATYFVPPKKAGGQSGQNGLKVSILSVKPETKGVLV